MWKHRFSALGVVIGAAVAACYGAGPTPTPPSNARVLWQAPAPPGDGSGACVQKVYVGPLAFGSTSGYVIGLPYVDAGGSSFCSSTVSAGVMTFPLDGSMPRGAQIPQNQAGTYTASSNGFGPVEPLLAANGDTVEFVYYSQMNTPTIGPVQSSISELDGSASTVFEPMPNAIVLDQDSLYAAVPVPQGVLSGVVDPFNPQFPCCTQQPAFTTNAQIGALDLPANKMTPALVHWIADATLWCGELEHCLVGSATSLFFVGPGNGGSVVATVSKLDKPTPANLNPIATQIATVDTAAKVPPGAVPVGLAVDATRVVVVMANAPVATSDGAIEPGCWIVAHDLSLAPGPSQVLLQSTDFSCMGAALDADHVYFTVVHTEPASCTGCTDLVHGDGVGRVPLSGTQDLETVAFSMQGATAGPRRVYMIAPGMMAVADPFAIAAVATDSLAGRHELVLPAN